MAVIGSPFVSSLLSAIRARGHWLDYGDVSPSVPSAASEAVLGVAVRGGVSGVPKVELAWHPVGRLTAKVTIHAGPTVEEKLVESSVFDLATGSLLAPSFEALVNTSRGGTAPGTSGSEHSAARVDPRPLSELLPHFIKDIEHSLAADLSSRRQSAQLALSGELVRIDGYYTAMLAGPAGPGTDVPTGEDRRAIEAEHAKRRNEEIRRHSLRCSVHPVQLETVAVMVQRAEWSLTAGDRVGLLAGVRSLSGDGSWVVRCPTCGRAPRELAVCTQSHVACVECATPCSVCGRDCCTAHGLGKCHLDGAPACSEHLLTCAICNRAACTAHQGRCSEGDHPACAACLGACALCSRVVCATHSITTRGDSPRGARILCSNCFVYCEGGTSEPVGVDEVSKCASCDRHVCELHQARCDVDGLIHCSTHLRRSDNSRRLLCDAHRGHCSAEPEVIYASDELAPCATCGAIRCAGHGGVCAGDYTFHCREHLAPLADAAGALACETHRTVCHIDRRCYSLGRTRPCPICQRQTCQEHLLTCKWCERLVCSTEVTTSHGRCATCNRLSAVAQFPEETVPALAQALEGKVPRPKDVKVAIDSSNTILEVDLGWTRRAVIVLLHGDAFASHIARHSLLSG
jgi:hypothetical protein